MAGVGAGPSVAGRELFWRFDAAHRFPGYPEGTAAEADGGIFGHLKLEFAPNRVRARVNLDNGLTICAYPDEPATDCYGAVTNGFGLDSSNKFTTLTINSLNRSIAFIANPDRPLPCRQGTRIGTEVDRRSNLVGGRINAIEFVVSCPGDLDGAKGRDDARTVRWQRNHRFLRTTLGGISP